jgi:sodium/pantothenate symporter
MRRKIVSNIALIPFILFLIIIFAVGMYTARSVNKADSFVQEYFLGSRQMGGFILAMSMMATYGSASTFIGGPGAAYTYGLSWVLLAMSQVVTGYFVLLVLGKKFAIMSRKYNAVTLIDYLQGRYGSKSITIFASISIIVFLFSAMIAQWVGGARLIESLTGLSYRTALVFFAVSVLVYVIVGGFRAVAVTDAIQGLVMMAGTLILLIAIVHAGGGMEAIMNDLKRIDPGLVTPNGPDRQFSSAYISSFWILVGVGVVGLPQVAVRAMGYKDSRSMHRALIIGTIVVGIVMLGMHLSGVLGRSVLPGIEDADKVMPTLTLEVLPPWVSGIVLAAPMAAIMSTVDALLLMVSSALVKDVYMNFINKDAQENQIRRVSLWVTALTGVLVFFLSLSPPDLIIWLNLFSFGGLEAVFIWPIVLGLYWRRGNGKGALASMVTGLVSYVLFYHFIPNFMDVNTVVFPILISLVVYIIVSLVTKDQYKEGWA